MTVISHNLMAMNTRRQLGITTKSKAKSTEKLSSGYKINRSADDAAGLQISEKLRWQVRGLNKASDNIADGISLIQVADGALNETHSVLQRMRELAVQAANDTNTEADREAIQSEIDQLAEEVDRIAEDTNFNGEIYPLKGGNATGIGTISQWKLPTDIHEMTFNVKADINAKNFFVDGVPLTAGSSTTMTVLRFFNYNWVTYDWGACSMNYTGFNDNEIYGIGLADLKMDENGYVYYESHFSRYGTNKFYFTQDSAMGAATPVAPTPDNIQVIQYFQGTKVTNTNGKSDDSLWIQMGAKSSQGMFLNLVNATANGIGLTNISVSNHGNASSAITTIDKAIEKVSDYRSTFGAQQNRLEHAKAADDNTSENTQAAESRIRDTDMALEMVELSKHNILEQAGQAMLAQANQSTQGILNLLQ